MSEIFEHPHSGRISHRSLHDELAERVREMIVTGVLAASSRVDERELCERFGVSRTPLREALKVLAAEGYVMLIPRRGAWVAGLPEEDLNEAFPIMAALEALAGEMACTNATDAEIDHIAQLTHEMADHHNAGRRDLYFDLNQKIHLAIAEAARNQILWRMQRSLDGRVRRGRYQANISSSRWDQAMQEHIEIASALRARDGARTGLLLRQHLDNKSSALRESLRKNQGDANNPTDGS